MVGSLRTSLLVIFVAACQAATSDQKLDIKCVGPACVYEPGSMDDPIVRDALRGSSTPPDTTVTMPTDTHFRTKPFTLSGSAIVYGTFSQMVEVSTTSARAGQR